MSITGCSSDRPVVALFSVTNILQNIPSISYVTDVKKHAGQLDQFSKIKTNLSIVW